ncbi:hypothetical protein [Streptomyces sp. NPDC046862]|uniref:hypothetical protein n=1 Tax=Streptomyces sp. NPDC046862 TaxID=3154603 RepID=UPI0034539E24
MNAKQRALRNRTREQRTLRHAHKAIATGTPQTARTHLVAAGLDDTTAKRYAGAFSRGATADVTTEATIKLKGRTRKAVPVKLYSATTFTARLLVYRPKDLTAAARFEQAAHRLAA